MPHLSAPSRPTLADIRSQFPALSSETALLDNAGGSQLPETVIEHVREYMQSYFVQLNGGYAISRKATSIYDDAHDWINLLMNGRGMGRVILGPSSTQLCHMLAGCYRKVLRPGDEVILAECGHESNIGAWLGLPEQGVRLRWWRVDTAVDGLSLESLDQLLTSRTRLVCFPHVSNLLGGIVDVAEIARRVHAVGGRVVVDGVAFAPHRTVDVASWNVDWYFFSTYKVFGPHMGALYGRTDAIDELTGPNHFFIPKEKLPYKFQLGGASHEGCAGLLGLRPYLNFLVGNSPPGAELVSRIDREAVAQAFDFMAELELPLQKQLIDGLLAIRGIRLVGPRSTGPERVAIASFVHDRVPAHAISAAAHSRNVGFRNGHMYSYRLCEALGIDTTEGVVRISAAHYTTPDEIERALNAVRSVVA